MIKNIQNEIEEILGFPLIRRDFLIGENKVKDEYIKQNIFFRNIEKQKIDKAISLIEKYLDDVEKNEIILACLGYLYMYKEDYNKSINCFLKTVSINPDNVNNWIDLSDLYELSGDRGTAKVLSLNYTELVNLYNDEIKKELTEEKLMGFIEKEYKEASIDARKTDICRIVNLDKNLISVTGSKRRTGRRLLFINPPVEEPFIGLGKITENFSLNDKSIELNKFYCLIDGELYIKRNLTPIEPLALMQVSNALLEQGNEIIFLDCLAVLPDYYKNSRERVTSSKELPIQLTEKHHARYFHLGMPYDEIKESLKKLEEIDEIYISCGLTYHNVISHKLIGICKEVMPETKVIFGGIYPTLLPDEAKKSMADEIYQGKYPCANQRLNYHILGYTPSHMTIKGTSGCNQNCDYCAVKYIEGEKFKFRDPDDVLSEIEFNKKQYGLSKVCIIDSNVLIDYDQYFGKVLKDLSNKKFRLFTIEGVDYRLLNQEIANDLFNGGFRYMFLALDIFEDPDCVKKLKRANDLGQFKKAVEMLKKGSFRGNRSIEVFVLVGTPDQTTEETVKVIKYIWSLGVNANIFCFTPIPGTKMYHDIFDKIKDKEQKELHPALFACANKNEIDNFIEIMKLNILSENGKLQSAEYENVIESDELKRLLK